MEFCCRLRKRAHGRAFSGYIRRFRYRCYAAAQVAGSFKFYYCTAFLGRHHRAPGPAQTRRATYGERATASCTSAHFDSAEYAAFTYISLRRRKNRVASVYIARRLFVKALFHRNAYVMPIFVYVPQPPHRTRRRIQETASSLFFAGTPDATRDRHFRAFYYFICIFFCSRRLRFRLPFISCLRQWYFTAPAMRAAAIDISPLV